jgi:crossover junction endodeoxyribonuclease RusA
VGRVKTGKYKAWIEEAGYELLGQHRRHVMGRVRIAIEIADGESRADPDNLFKPLLDLAVLHGLIDGDSWRTIKGLSLDLVEGLVGLRLTITPLA